MPSSLGRRAFLAGSSVLLGCSRGASTSSAPATASVAVPVPPAASAPAPVSVLDAGQVAPAPPSVHALFDAYPALAKSLPRIALGSFPSAIDHAPALVGDGSLWIKRDDDFTRSLSSPAAPELVRLFGGGKVRKLELYLGEARAQGKRTLITSGGTGSNQALAVALLGKALGFAVRVHLTPQPASTLTKQNLAADAAALAEMRLFDTVGEGHAAALSEAAKRGSDVYVIPPGGTTPLGTIGFVNAGLELAADVRAGRMVAPKSVYIALGLGGSASGLAIGCALGGLLTEVVAVRASSPGSVTAATLRAIHGETMAFLRARDPSMPAVSLEAAKVRIDGRFVGAGYGAPSAAGADAIARARAREGWELDPVYTGKALAALLDDAAAPNSGSARLFWNTMSSRPVVLGDVPPSFRRFLK